MTGAERDRLIHQRCLARAMRKEARRQRAQSERQLIAARRLWRRTGIAPARGD